MPAPRVIYIPKPGSPIDVDRDFYGRLGQETDSRSLVDKFRGADTVRQGLAGDGGPDMPHRRRRRRTGGRLQRLEPEQPQGALLGRRAPNSFTAPTSPSSTGCGRACPTCGPCSPSPATRWTMGWTRTAPDAMICWARAATRTSTRCSTARTSTTAATPTLCGR